MAPVESAYRTSYWSLIVSNLSDVPNFRDRAVVRRKPLFPYPTIEMIAVGNGHGNGFLHSHSLPFPHGQFPFLPIPIPNNRSIVAAYTFLAYQRLG